MQEYASTVRSTDVGLPWEIHFKAKKQFEATDLQRIFKFCIQLLSEIVKNDPPYDTNITSLTENLLIITENILTWGYISPMLPKRIIGVYEAVYESDQAPPLRLSSSWQDVMLAPQFLPLMFQVYWKVRDQDCLAHHALTCLVQLASLTGGITTNDDIRIQYLTSYMENFLKLTSNVTIKSKESLGISNIIRKLQLFFDNDLLKLSKGLQESYLDDITRLTCCFTEGAALEEAVRFYLTVFLSIKISNCSNLQKISIIQRHSIMFWKLGLV